MIKNEEKSHTFYTNINLNELTYSLIDEYKMKPQVSAQAVRIKIIKLKINDQKIAIMNQISDDDEIMDKKYYTLYHDEDEKIVESIKELYKSELDIKHVTNPGRLTTGMTSLFKCFYYYFHHTVT